MYKWSCCRMCLSTNYLNPIFAIPDHHNKYTRIILDSCGIQVIPDDRFPQYICNTCITSVNENYKFRKKCAETQKTLESQLKHGQFMIKMEFELKTEGSSTLDITDLIYDKHESSNINIECQIFNNIDKVDCFKSNFNVCTESESLQTNCSRELNENPFLVDIGNSTEDNLIEDVLKDNISDKNKASNKIDNSIEDDINNFDNENIDNFIVDKPEKLNVISKRRSKRNVKSKNITIGDVNMTLDAICDEDDEQMLLGKDSIQHESNIENVNGKLSQVSKIKAIKKEKKDKTKTARRRREKVAKQETNREPVECEYCHKKLSSRLSIPNHYKIHTGFNIVCEHCGKKFISRRILLMHCRARHGYEKTDKCRFCDYKASNADQVKIHERLHTGEKPFVCKECGAAFIRNSTYKQHIATHLTEKNVECDQCPARFKSVTLMKIHKNKHKPNQYVFKCRICNNSFVRRRNVTRHLERIHKMQPEPALLERVKVGTSELDTS
ncbi:hypothetical protein K1T71_014352 [Dendrolimus kikuchii]|uniref:Uncharacterized protein n=1 Tax=Dendrolimus kikuchii TaxID=765133 RepID=A0ACC1CE14_9NEOP|nr:hypothetical protein K1T71_014352 [Dendrolimus kikuchii]